MEENETLKSVLQKEQHQSASLKVCLSHSSLIQHSSDQTDLLSNRENSWRGTELWCWGDLFPQVQNEQKDKEKSQLVEELDQMKGQSENLRSALQQQLKETERLQVCCQSTKGRVIMMPNPDNDVMICLNLIWNEHMGRPGYFTLNDKAKMVLLEPANFQSST